MERNKKAKSGKKVIEPLKEFEGYDEIIDYGEELMDDPEKWGRTMADRAIDNLLKKRGLAKKSKASRSKN